MQNELERRVGDPDSVMLIDGGFWETDLSIMRAAAGVKETVAEVDVPLFCEPRVMVGPVRAWQVRNTEAIARN